MESTSSHHITALLIAWGQGDQNVKEPLAQAVYDELRRLAQFHLRNERAAHTLQATALVNEAWLRLVTPAGESKVEWQNRAHFFGLAAHLMREILVEHARRRGRLKRGANATQVTLDQSQGWAQKTDVNLLALDDALHALAKFSPRQNQIVELRFFGGLTVEEVATVLHVSPITIKRDWVAAKAWLYRELQRV
jgi:RNA polymerase sigma factor (TIGR02999 family)